MEAKGGEGRERHRENRESVVSEQQRDLAVECGPVVRGREGVEIKEPPLSVLGCWNGRLRVRRVAFPAIALRVGQRQQRRRGEAEAEEEDEAASPPRPGAEAVLARMWN